MARKLVVAPSLGSARELLRRLAREPGGWVGFEVTTPRPMALRLAQRSLEGSGLVPLDPFDQQAILDEALDSALLTGSGRLGQLSEGVGFRERVHGAITALRLAGVTPDGLDRARLPDREKRVFLLRVLQRYERLLAERRRADTATILGFALDALEAAGRRWPSSLRADMVLLLPGLGTRGLAGHFASALAARGARVLKTDPVVGADVPEFILWNRGDPVTTHAFLHAPGRLPELLRPPVIEMFRAASINDELREVLRRALERGLRWDQVEIITSDPAAYGSALHAIARRMEIPTTYAVGLPVERTRTGRVVRAYLDWIEEGFQADPIRRLLEAGDLRPPRGSGRHAPAVLARRFRSLRIGWGRNRYRTQIRNALAGIGGAEAKRRGTEEAFERRVERARGELEAIKSILFPALRATPTVPDRLGEGRDPVSPAEIARGLSVFLRRVPRGRGVDRAAREEIKRILERVEATLRRRTDFRAAVTILRRHTDVRVRAAGGGREPDDVGAPWVSEGGHLHLSDFEHGGHAGREAVYFVGIDADRVPGVATQDPVLLDADRRILGASLPTSSEVTRERTFRLAALFARLRGPVTLSYGAWNAMEARSVAPSPMLLRALRLSRRDPSLTFKDLHEGLGRVVCAVPRSGVPPLDQDDVWMAELGGGEVMLRGLDAVGVGFPRIAAGVRAQLEREGGVPGPSHGVVAPRPDVLDPRANPELVLSASRLEALGACPLRYLHATVLGLRPPDDPILDPDVWLDARRRGSLLHDVYEAALRVAQERGYRHAEPEFESLAIELLRSGVGRLREDVPSPGEAIVLRESAVLEQDVRSFVRMVRQVGAPWVKLEFAFGLGSDEPVQLELDRGSIHLRGAIDRIDDGGIEGIRVVDYKTGVARGFGDAGTFDGGRRLQHAIYALAVEARLGGQVAAGEYHYPTSRGENEVFRFERAELAGVRDLLGHLLDGVAAGAFVPTDRADDCRFCDFTAICRVRTGDYGNVSSPPADWSQQLLNAGVWPVLQPLKRARSFED